MEEKERNIIKEGKSKIMKKIKFICKVIKNNLLVVWYCIIVIIVAVGLIIKRNVNVFSWDSFDFISSYMGIVSVIPAIAAWLVATEIKEKIKATAVAIPASDAQERSAVLAIKIGQREIIQHVEDYLIKQRDACTNDDPKRMVFSQLCGEKAQKLAHTDDYPEKAAGGGKFQVCIKEYLYKNAGRTQSIPEPIVEIRSGDMPIEGVEKDEYMNEYRETLENVLIQLQADGVQIIHFFIGGPLVLSAITSAYLDNNFKVYLYHRDSGTGKYYLMDNLQRLGDWNNRMKKESERRETNE